MTILTDPTEREAAARARALAEASKAFARSPSAIWDALVDAYYRLFLLESTRSPDAIATEPPPSAPEDPLRPIPPDAATSPDLTSVRCPGCGRKECEPACPVCRGTGSVSRATFEEWHSRQTR